MESGWREVSDCSDSRGYHFFIKKEGANYFESHCGKWIATPATIILERFKPATHLIECKECLPCEHAF